MATQDRSWIPTSRSLVSKFASKDIQISETKINGESYFVVTDQFGFIPSAQAWQGLVQECNKFYQVVSQEEIDRHNQAREARLHPQETPYYQHREKQKPNPRPGYVYLFKAGAYYKIGVTIDVDKRARQLKNQPPFDLEVIHTIQTNDSYGLEARLHERFASKRKNGEWFTLDEADVEYIKSLGGEHNGKQPS